jgi:hypothetical protein
LKNIIDDLKVFIGKWAGIKVEHVETFYVYQRLLEIFFITCEQKAEYMFLDIFKDKKQITIEDVIRKIYNELGQLKVFDSKTDKVIWDLGKPDYNILSFPSIDLPVINDFT